MWNVKRKRSEQAMKKKQTHRYSKQTGGCQSREQWGISERGGGNLRGTNFPLRNKGVIGMECTAWEI